METASHIIEITDLGAPDLEVYAHLNEVQLRHYYEPHGGIFIGESPNVILRALDAGYEPVSLLLEKKYLETEAKEIVRRCPEVPTYVSTLEVLSQITGYHLTRGILCAFRRRPLPDPSDILRAYRRVAVLDNVENPTNVGAILRSAAALNMDAVLLTPQTADPLYRRAIRVSVGTVFQIPWTYLVTRDADWPEKGMQILHDAGFRTAALALRSDTIRIDNPRLQQEERLAVILGNEGEGLKEETIQACDYRVRIPMSHGVDSLNVAACSAVVFWELGKVRR